MELELQLLAVMLDDGIEVLVEVRDALRHQLHQLVQEVRSMRRAATREAVQAEEPLLCRIRAAVLVIAVQKVKEDVLLVRRKVARHDLGERLPRLGVQSVQGPGGIRAQRDASAYLGEGRGLLVQRHRDAAAEQADDQRDAGDATACVCDQRCDETQGVEEVYR